MIVQVYNLHSTPPKDFLLYGLGTLEKLAENGDECARKTRNRLRIIVSSILLSEELCNTSEFFFLSKCPYVVNFLLFCSMSVGHPVKSNYVVTSSP